MTLTLQEVEHIAELARLSLSAEEKARYREQLSAILDYAARLQALDTSGIPPTSSVLPAYSVLREDEPRPSLSLEDLLRNAPVTESNQFRVPPILSEGAGPAPSNVEGPALRKIKGPIQD
jgi:aspartyl-tRNA(Asn)/glutamyl-tRNA(Gln) amidotransferase subunit C